MLKSIVTLALAIIGTGIQAQSWETLTPQNTCIERHECSGAAVKR